ncbi:Bug family tripartite tricarboxylate transporter substrate binding protein [Achromobacter aegrifaciens]
MSLFRLGRRALLCTALLALTGAQALAQQYPVRPITLIVPVAPGGLTDVVARIVGERLGERLGQPVIVENRAGGGGIVAMKAVSKRPPDGYSLVLVFPGSAALNPILYQPPPYDTLQEFTPIARLVMYALVLIENPNVAVDGKAFLAAAQRKPGALSYGSAGITTSSHLAMELLKREAHLDIVHIPYKGELSALSEVLAGRIAVQFPTLGIALPFIRDGKVKAIGVATAQRSKLAPDIPTLAEAGLPGLDIPGWYGILAPASTPKPIVERLNHEINAILAEPDTVARLEKLGVQPWSSTPEQLGDWIRVETDRWKSVVEQAGIKPE